MTKLSANTGKILYKSFPSLSLSVLNVAGSFLSVDDELSRLSKYGSNKGLLGAIYSVVSASGSYFWTQL
jgi:hypothetical protein